MVGSRRLWPQTGVFSVMDEHLTRTNPHVIPALHDHDYPIEQWRALFFESGGINWMPREGASRRQVNASLSPKTSISDLPGRLRSRP